MITGASRGLGRAITLALAAAGTGRRALVAPTGVARVKPFAEMSPDDWRFMMDVNLTGVFNGCRAAAPHLIAQRAGKVINVPLPRR
ncbi:MAG: SDR family NAD(P)-dependent oxidoreductase, partial [Candidatus Rokubacteria bacterium]|nr:SDR family NAD(P)-dependent oxidoreductase [Candidatus Rokubacteria bacterium]